MKIIQLLKQDLHCVFRSPKVMIVLLLTVFFLMDFSRDLRGMCELYQTGVSPYIYIVYLTTWRGRLFITLLMLILVSDAPFYNGSEIFLAVRVSKYQWLAGKFLLIAALSAIYQIVLMIISVLVFLPYVGISSQWGDIIEMYLEQGENMITADGIANMGNLLENSPIKVMFMQFILMVLFGILVGMCILILNGIFRNSVGTVLLGIIVSADAYMTDLNFYIPMPELMTILPSSWLNPCDFFGTSGMSFGKSCLYMTIMIVLLILVSIAVTKKNYLSVAEGGSKK